MHPRYLDQRNRDAHARILAAVKALAGAQPLAPELLAALSPADRDPQVRVLKEREALADVLEAVVRAQPQPPAEAEPPAESAPPPAPRPRPRRA